MTKEVIITKIPEDCLGCPIIGECNINHDINRCNWKATFVEAGFWNRKLKEEAKTKSKFEPIPKNTKVKVGKFVLAEGIIDVEKRYTTFPTETIVGLFRRENGASNFGNVEHDLAWLNGCKVRVEVEILEVPKINKKMGGK